MESDIMRRTGSPRPIDPEALGPIDGEPRSGPGTLFAGDARWLGAREIRRRRALWGTLASRMEVVLEDGEHVLYVARAARALTIGMYLGLGWTAQRYHQAALVVTDRRLVEVLLGFDGATIEPGTRGFPWSAVTGLKLRMSTLTLTGPDGKRSRWTLPVRGDRKLLKAIVPRIAERLLGGAGERPASFPVEHCPGCAAVRPSAEGECERCGALVRSARLATLLSLAIPGGGLAYVGHPVLAAFDFLGEAMILGIVAVGLATAGSAAEIAAVALVGAVMAVATKVESIHVSRLLAHRRRPEPAARRDRFRAFVRVGTIASVAALAGVALLTGRFVEALDHDLAFAGAEADGWSGSRVPGTWVYFADDPTLRSEWTHESGLRVSVFAYPGEPANGLRSQAAQYVRAEQDAGAVILDRRDGLPAGLEGYRIVERFDRPDGAVAVVSYFVLDPEGRDLHQILAAVDPDAVADVETLVEGLLSSARWIAPVEPRQPAP